MRVGFFAAANSLAEKLAAGALPPEKASVAPTLIFNLKLDAALRNLDDQELALAVDILLFRSLHVEATRLPWGLFAEFGPSERNAAKPRAPTAAHKYVEATGSSEKLGEDSAATLNRGAAWLREFLAAQF